MQPSKTLEFRRKLRHDATDAERKLWAQLRSRRFSGFKFRRQFGVGPYIADFCCLKERLIVELDGGQHGGEYDQKRDAYLQAMGYRVLRIWNNEFLKSVDVALEAIYQALNRNLPSSAASPHLLPPAGGRRITS